MTPIDTRMSIAELNALDDESFVAALAPVFEGPPWIPRSILTDRGVSLANNVEKTYKCLCAAMYGAPRERQVTLIRAHPDLVGRAARAGALSVESTGEQAAAGLDRLSPAEIAVFTHLNAAYNRHFGFPFVICARENRKESILAGFAACLDNTRDEEIDTALGEIAKIAHFRLRDRFRDE